MLKTSLIGIGLMLLQTLPICAHAVLIAATPTPNSTLQGPTINVHLRFNARIDGQRSVIRIVLPDHTARTLPIGPQSSPDALSCSASGLDAGAYRLRWQVLAADGHITQGEISFQVK